VKPSAGGNAIEMIRYTRRATGELDHQYRCFAPPAEFPQLPLIYVFQPRLELT
jgi:hypothetical protein